MFSAIVGGTVMAMGGVAATGAAASVYRGLVRGLGRVAEGDPLTGLKEVVGGVVEPVAVTVVQIGNLAVDTVNVVAYSAMKVASCVSPETNKLLKEIGGFDNVLGAAIIAASVPAAAPLTEKAKTAA